MGEGRRKETPPKRGRCYLINQSGRHQVEANSSRRTEIDGNALGIIRIHVERSRGQSDFSFNLTGLGIINHTGAFNAIHVKLHRCANLLTQQNVLDDAVRERSILISEVHSSTSVCVTKTRNVLTEGNILAQGLTNGCNVDFSPADFDAPIACFGNHAEF